MTDDTGQGRNGNDMLIEPVELIPDTGDDDNEIGEPFLGAASHRRRPEDPPHAHGAGGRRLDGA